MNRTLLLGGALLLWGCGPAGRPTGDELLKAEARIDEQDLRAHVSVLADDSMKGRDTPSPELWQAASYIAAELETSGLKPWGESFVVPYSLQERGRDTLRTALVTPDGRSWSFRTSILPRGGGTPEGGVRGGTVALVGNPEQGTDLSAVDVTGKIAVLVLPEYQRGLGRGFFSVTAGLAAHPAAYLVISDAPQTAWDQRAVYDLAPSYQVADEELTVPIVEVRADALAATLSGAGLDLSDVLRDLEEPLRVIELPEVELQVRTPQPVVRTLDAPIVAGTVGSRRTEGAPRSVVLSAHMDHLGSTLEGEVYAGADDNASGVAASLELAQAFGPLAGRLDRRLVFLFTSGEEDGGWGVDAFLERIAHPVDDFVTNINLDMLGRNARDTIHLLEPDDGNLGALARSVSAEHPELSLTVAGDSWPGAGFLRRSDQKAFLDLGIPAAFVFAGPHEDYHQTSDTPEKLDYVKIARVTRLVFYLLTALALTPSTP